MSIQDDPNRVVRTVNSTIAFIGHNQQANEDVLIELFVDAQTNKVTFESSSHARKGIDFVEANESVQPLLDKFKENFPEPITMDKPDEVNTGNEGNIPISGTTTTKPIEVEIPQWQKEGFPSKADWKRAHGKD